MESKQNPFSFYDFLGYFTPGAIFLYALVYLSPFIPGMSEISELLKPIREIDDVGGYVPFVLSAYVVGHILSFLSSITVERYSIWSSGYPSKYLLGVHVDGYFTFGKPWRVKLTGRVLLIFILLPIILFDFLIGYWLKFRELYKLDGLLADLIKLKIQALLTSSEILKKGPSRKSPVNDDYFRFVYHYCVEHAPNHLPKMQNYVALYGFLRTLTFIAVLGCWALLSFLVNAHLGCLRSMLLISLAGFFSYILFMAFTKFYRRFTLEAFMALTAIYPPKK
jgi:hypothetical protein